MLPGIFAKTFAGTSPLEVLTAARDAGYETVQYNMVCSGLGSLPQVIPSGTAEAIRNASIETGVSIAAVSATYNMVHPNRQERERGRQSFTAIASAAARMGTRLLTVSSGSCHLRDQWTYHPANDTPEAWQELCREFQLLLRIAQKEDLLLAVEPERTNVVSSAERARRLLDTFRNDRIRIVPDPANLFEVAPADLQRELVDNALALLDDSIVLAHAKDRLSDGRITPVGTGVLDFPHYLRALRRARFNGALITHGLHANDAGVVAESLRNLIEESIVA